MKILHLLSNWKWTERADPAAGLALAEQELGHEVTFVCNRAPEEIDDHVEFRALERGLKKVFAVRLPKHLDLFSLNGSVQDVRKLISKLDPDVVHAHMPNAHLLACMARGRRKRPIVVRSCYDPDWPEGDNRSIFVANRWTDGLIAISKKTMDHVLENVRLESDAVKIIEPSIDLDRFSPKQDMPDLRENLGFEKTDFVVGVVSRIRKERRLDIPLKAVSLLKDEFPNLRLMIVGRGAENAEDEVVRKPAAELGISDRVVLAGYCFNDKLVSAFRTMDVLSYPMPGTDKSCRTVREAMASRLPVIASNVGFLPELIDDYINGAIVDLSAEDLACVIHDFIENRFQLKEMAVKALETAECRFDPVWRANATIAFYKELLGENAV